MSGWRQRVGRQGVWFQGVWFQGALRDVLSIGCAVLAVLYSHAAPACDSAGLLFPQNHATVRDARPLFTWAAVPGATGYRVRIASRVPEGRAIDRIDTRTARPEFAAFTLAGAMRGEPRVKVLLEVETECGAHVAPAAVAEFLLENPAPCALADGALPVLRNGMLSWPAHAASQAYEVCVSANDGVVNCARPIVAQLGLAARQRPPLLVSIAPVCDGAGGAAGTPRLSVVRE